MEKSNALDNLKLIINDLYRKAKLPDEGLDKLTNVIELNQFLTKDCSDEDYEDYYSEEFDQISDEDKQEIIESALLDKNIEICDLWKYVLIFQTIKYLGFYDAIELEEKARTILCGLADSPMDAVNILESGLSAVEIYDPEYEGANYPSQEVVDLILGCFCLGVELALNDGDEDGVNLWVVGLPVGYSFEENPVSLLIIDLKFGDMDLLIEPYMELLKEYFLIDTFDEDGDFRDEENGVHWESVSEYIFSANA